MRNFGLGEGTPWSGSASSATTALSCRQICSEYLAAMDSLIASAARFLAAGDPLQALKRVALRNDPPALAMRGIAMAQLGDYERARKLLRRAARGFGARERLSQARCQVAEAEVSLAVRDLTRRMHNLDAAAQALDA